MMNFRIVKQAAIDLVGDKAESRFRVIGYQGQSQNANEIIGNDRLVRIENSGGDFPKNAGRFKGAKTHDMTLDIIMSASAKAKGDLTVLESASATAIQKAAALASVQEAAKVVDDLTDELIDAVYQILMDARYDGLRLEKGIVTSRWIESWQKDTTIENGDLVVKTANMKYTCRVQEDVGGDIGNEPDTVIFNSNLPVGDTAGAGVEVENENT